METMALILEQTDRTQLWTQLIGAAVVLVPVILNYLKSLKTEQKVVALSSSLVDEDGKQKIDKVQEKVATLATNIDGAMAEIKETIAAKSLAEGKLEGIAGEQARTQELITEPSKVTEAMNGKDVREQIDKIEAATSETNDTLSEQKEKPRAGVRKQIDAIESAVTEKKAEDESK